MRPRPADRPGDARGRLRSPAATRQYTGRRAALPSAPRRRVRGGRYVAAARLDGAHLAELVRSLDADPTLRAVLLELAAARVDRRFEVRAGRLVVVFLAHLLCSFEADVD